MDSEPDALEYDVSVMVRGIALELSESRIEVHQLRAIIAKQQADAAAKAAQNDAKEATKNV